jgi:hypothetical protein
MSWQLVIPLISAVIGGFVVHLLTARRERASKRREQKIGYLIEAYRRLEVCSQRCTPSETAKLESAVADIQLLGSSRQVELVQHFAREFAARKTASLDDLLRDLRRDLRAELRLEAVANDIVHLRISYYK